jgi:D-alanine-D-alanine ligase
MAKSKRKIKVGVLRGGSSDEHDVSLKTGKSVLDNLPENFSGYDIFLSKDGNWYFEGKLSDPEKIFRTIDVVFNALHGKYGEDGKVQQLLEKFGVPYTGSGIFGSALGMNKALAREAFARAGLNVPKAVVIDLGVELLSEKDVADKIFKSMGPSWVVKPVSSGSSVGVSIAHNFNELVEAVKISSNFDSKLLIEEYIKGREATCGVIENFRGANHYSLPVIEIIPSENHNFFNYEAKYGGGTKEICPACFDSKIKKEIEEMARTAHQALGLRHYSRADFIVSPKGIYILEVNTLPGLTTESLLPKGIKAVGSSYPEFLEHLINLALDGK